MGPDLTRHDGSSGLGDCGRSGITQFKRQHICNDICKQLGLGWKDDPSSDEDELINSNSDGIDDDHDYVPPTRSKVARSKPPSQRKTKTRSTKTSVAVAPTQPPISDSEFEQQAADFEAGLLSAEREELRDDPTAGEGAAGEKCESVEGL